MTYVPHIFPRRPDRTNVVHLIYGANGRPEAIEVPDGMSPVQARIVIRLAFAIDCALTPAPLQPNVWGVTAWRSLYVPRLPWEGHQ